MEKITSHIKDPTSIVYRGLNAFLIGIILYSLSTVFQLSMKESSDYFKYKSITPTSQVFSVSGELTFISDLERYHETNMRYNDTLFCGFSEKNLYWYSQALGEFNYAPKGQFLSMWKYDGEIPTMPMICQLRSAPYASLLYGINTKPQFINTDIFYVK